MPDAPDDLVDAKGAAELLERTVSTVHRLNELGRLPHAMKLSGLRGPKLFARSTVLAAKEALDNGEAA